MKRKRSDAETIHKALLVAQRLLSIANYENGANLFHPIKEDLKKVPEFVDDALNDSGLTVSALIKGIDRFMQYHDRSEHEIQQVISEDYNAHDDPEDVRRDVLRMREETKVAKEIRGALGAILKLLRKGKKFNSTMNGGN